MTRKGEKAKSICRCFAGTWGKGSELYDHSLGFDNKISTLLLTVVALEQYQLHYVRG